MTGVGQFDDRAEFALVEGFEQIPVGLGGAGTGEGRLVRIGGEENDRHAVFGLEAVGGFNAVHALFQLDVHEHHVRLEPLHGHEGFLAGAAKGGDFETELFKRGFKVPCHEGLVLHYQDTQGIHLIRCSRGCVRTSVRTPGTCNNGKFSGAPGRSSTAGDGAGERWVRAGKSGKKCQYPDPGRCLR